MSDDLLPVTRNQLADAIRNALAVSSDYLPTRGRNGTPPVKMDEARRRLADRLADQLLLSQYVVHRKPPREPHSIRLGLEMP